MSYSLKTKLIGRFTIVLLLMIFVGLVGIYFSKSVQKQQERLIEQDIKAMHLLSDVSRLVGHIRANSKLYLISESVDDMKRYESEIADWQSMVEKNLNNLENITKNGVTIGKLTEFRSAWETYLKIWNTQVRPLSRAKRNKEAFALVRKRGTAGRAAINAMEKLDELHDAIITKAAYRIELAKQDFRKSQMISLGVILVAIILGSAFAIKQSSNIAAAVNAVSNTAKLIAAGDLERSVKVKTGDEIESMADSFNIMVSNMKKMVEELRHEITEREKAEKALQEAKDGLEVKVEERAAELLAINNNLKNEIEERKKVEEALRQSEKKFKDLIEYTTDLVWEVDEQGVYTYVSPKVKDILGYEIADVLGKTPFDLMPEKETEKIHNLFKQKVINKEPFHRLENVNLHKDGHFVVLETNGIPILNEKGQLKGYRGIDRDITERKRTDEQIKRQLERITALRNIDMAITSSLDLRVTLQVFLDQLTNVLHVNAAAVLLLNPNTLNLEYTASRGFRTSALQYTKLRLGNGRAGRAALEQKMLSVSNIAEEIDTFSRSELLASEEFVSYYAMPLITKGNVKGVLEIFQRAPLDPSKDWLDFLEALTAQAAIAIDNATLFDNLQRSNIDLILSYDATIEGWSRALDYRDKETEGHSRRVTEMTLKIASAMGMSDKELVHVRRGALLHDIGKLGVPDAVLFKPGKLDDKEWEIMKRHPVLAYELLSPIEFLHPALDIPYCHHEKWDGTGYPRGLKGEQIPLAARIFAVVDVWDALSSDRPYRPAWAKEKITAYMKDNAGKNFDPKVVEAFLKMGLQY